MSTTGNTNAVLANRIIGFIYAVLANKIIRSIYLSSCVFVSRFERDLSPIRDIASIKMRLLVRRVVNRTLNFRLMFLIPEIISKEIES